MFEESQNAPSYSDEQMKAQANIWSWNMESNLKVWDEIGSEEQKEKEAGTNSLNM